MLHRFSQFVVGCTVLLVLAGSLVTSTGSGLAVPDWPTSYGWNMFTFPPSKWIGGIFYEHGHRLIASTVGFLTIILAAWIWRADSRRRLDGARRPGGNLLLHDGGDRALHVARLDRID
jgi:heme a synthase